MSQVLTFFAALFDRRDVRVTIRLDHSGVGAHLLWTITNGRPTAVTICRLLFRGAHGSSVAVPLDPARVIAPEGELILPIDVDWNLLGAHAIAAVAADEAEYAPPARQLASVQERLRQAIDRRRSAPSSARDFLIGAADLALGVMILGLGVFMLMWMIATA